METGLRQNEGQENWKNAAIIASNLSELTVTLHECDAHLEWARLCRQRGDRDGLERHVARARKLVEETGYERRRREVEWIGSKLLGSVLSFLDPIQGP
jgi:hypothetical protein